LIRIIRLAIKVRYMVIIQLDAVNTITISSLQPHFAAAVEVMLESILLPLETVHHQINATLEKEIAPVTVIASMV
jgi:hypothetical protein